MENGKWKVENVNHIEIIDRMMECLKTHTVDGVPIRPTLEAAKTALEKQEQKKVKSERLTKRVGNRVYINDGVIQRSECKGELGVTFCIHAHTCEYVREPERRCPVLRLMDRLAEYEDAEDDKND